MSDDKPIWEIRFRDGKNATTVFESFKVAVPTFDAAYRVAQKRLAFWRRNGVTSMRLHSIMLDDMLVQP
jgi:pyridoxine/pyridoxamine 5'-phosphate oxidase